MGDGTFGHKRNPHRKKTNIYLRERKHASLDQRLWTSLTLSRSKGGGEKCSAILFMQGECRYASHWLMGGLSLIVGPRSLVRWSNKGMDDPKAVVIFIFTEVLD